MRVKKSSPPPGGKGTMMRTGFVGQFCAVAAAGASSPSAASTTAATRNVVLPPMRSLTSLSSIILFRSFLSVVRRDCDARGTSRAIAPGVVGAALNDDVSCFQRHFLRIEHEHDLAFENDG